MVTPDQKRDAVAHLQSVILVGQAQPLSQRAACGMLGVQRALGRKPKTRCLKDAPLKQQLGNKAQLVSLSLQHPRYGYRRIHALVSRTSTQSVNIKRLHPVCHVGTSASDDQSVNIKRLHRLWKEAAHQVPPRKKRRPHRGKGPQKAPQYARYPGQVWSDDFVHDT